MEMNVFFLSVSLVIDCVFKCDAAATASAIFHHFNVFLNSYPIRWDGVSLIDAKHLISKAFSCLQTMAKYNFETKPKEKNYITFRFHLAKHKHSTETTMISNANGHFSSYIFYYIFFCAWIALLLLLLFSVVCVCVRTIYYWCW